MILLILGLLYLDYIPKEFQQLRRKALKSSQLKLLSHEEPEPIILPGKPFITDSFVGSVLHPIFGITNKELKGFAISKTKEHIALIADRETENGRSILNKKSVFFGLGNVSVSLTEKFADDGEVAIFNITDIDPLAAFYNFDMKLSPLSYDCKAELGKSFGARCWASFNKSWDQANNKPKEIDLSDVITNQSIREKIKIYVGAKANGEASAIIEKRGASLQAKFDGSLKVLAGAGFHIDQIHYTLPRKEFKIDPIVFGEGSVTILSIPVSLKASFTTTLAISDLSFDIPHEIDISRLVSIDIHKGYTISTKHGISPDFRKEIKVGTISTDSEEKGNNIEENYIKADFKATFSIWPAIKIDLSVGSSINFGAEVGPELGIDVNLGIDKEQCTYPGLYGTFTPFVNSTCVFSGSLKIANLQLLKFTKPISHRIYEKVLHSGCFFDGASSKELEKDYIQVERNRTVIYIENPKLINKSMSMLEKYEPIFFVGQTSTNEKPFYLGPATVYFSDDDKVYHYRDFVYVPEYNNFDNISIIPLEKDVIDEDDITFDYPFDRVSATTKALSFDIISQNSNAIDMGNQVIFANSGDIKNFRSKFISGTVKSQPIGLILHNKKDGYFNDPFKYVIHDEINNDVDEIIFNWAKLEVIEVQGKEPFNLYFSRKYEDTLYLKGVNGYLLAENNQSMSSVFIEKPYLVKINPDYYDSDFVGYFQLTTQNRESIGFINITKKEATHNSQFTKELGSYKITFKANSTVDDVEYIVNLNNIEVNESEKDSLKGVVTRIFEPHDSDYKPKFYEGKETPCVFIMQANEIYGILRFHFVDPEYDMKKNNNVYAFIKLPGSIPLLTSSHCIDEKDSCYSIKLEYGKSVFETDINKYILNIPFRRRKAGKTTINSILYCIYQSYDDVNENNDPFCPAFPSFTLKPIKNFYVGCIHSYLNPEDYSENQWIAYTKTNYKFDEDHLPGDKTLEANKPFSKLYIVKVKENTLSRKEETIDVFAMRDYFNYPLSSKTMIFENSTIEKLRTYASGRDLQIICDRCRDLYINSHLGQNKFNQRGNTFYYYSIDDLENEFSLEAYCSSPEETYCIFTYDISNDGTVLLEFNSNKNDGFDVNSKSILADAKIPEVYPGIEEIYNVEDDKNDKLAQSRFNINCRRQIIPGREDKIYLTKPWKGTIKKVAVNLEQQNINIKIAHRSWKGYTHIFMLADGLPSNNLESIPFNPNIIAKEHDSDVRKTLNEIGIDIQGKSIQKAIEDKELVFDNEGNIQVKNEFFKEDMLKNNINKNSIPMIGIPQGHYTLKHVKCEIKSKKKACSGTTEVRDPDYDDDVCADPMSNFDIKSAYLGVSTVFDDLKFSYKLMKNARKALGHLIPSPNFLHTGIWVGPSDATNETLGTILTYGNYHSNGRDPTFISKDGARAYSMTLSEFKDMFDASKTIKLTVQSNITLYNLIDEIKSGDKWNANHYSWALNNCQHFTTLCLNLLKTKRTSPNDNDWIDLPKTVLNTLKSNEK